MGLWASEINAQLNAKNPENLWERQRQAKIDLPVDTLVGEAERTP